MVHLGVNSKTWDLRAAEGSCGSSRCANKLGNWRGSPGGRLRSGSWPV